MNRMRTTVLALVASAMGALLPRAARAQDAQTDHSGLRLAADVALGEGIRYRREVEDDLPREVGLGASTQVGLALHYLFGPYIGLGAQVAGAFVPLRDDGLDGRAWALDMGPSLIARVPLRHVDLTLRLPFGLTLGAATVVDAGSEFFGVSSGLVTTTNRLGPGAHVAGLLGASFWLTDALALRLETGPWWRSFRVDEAAGVYLGSAAFATEQRDVSTRLLTWLVQVGLDWDV